MQLMQFSVLSSRFSVRNIPLDIRHSSNCKHHEISSQMNADLRESLLPDPCLFANFGVANFELLFERPLPLTQVVHIDVKPLTFNDIRRG